MLALPLTGSTPELYHGKYVAGGFASGEQGVWYEPSLSNGTLFQDAAGTIPVTNVEQPVGLMKDKSGRGNHAKQTTSADRPVFSARYNLLTSTAVLATQSVGTVATNYVLSFSGSGTVTLSGTATGTKSAGTNTFSATAGSLSLTVSGAVTDAQLLPAKQAPLPYQRVNTATDYDADPVKFPPYLKFNGVNSWMVTPSINFTGTDKMTVFSGVRKLSDSNTGGLLELSNNVASNDGSFALFAPSSSGSYRFFSKGSSVVRAAGSGTYAPAPDTSVVSGIGSISGDITSIRRNGYAIETIGLDQGSGNYGNYPLYIGNRYDASGPFNGWLHSLIIRGAATDEAHLTHTEKYIAYKTGITL